LAAKIRDSEKRALQEDTIAKEILAHFSDLENNPDETITPYLEFNVEGNLYHFTPGGFLYRRDSGTEAVGSFFCGYLTDEVWHYRTDQGLAEEEAHEEENRRSWWRRFLGLG
jgi:hypothetical protein